MCISNEIRERPAFLTYLLFLPVFTLWSPSLVKLIKTSSTGSLDRPLAGTAAIVLVLFFYKLWKMINVNEEDENGGDNGNDDKDISEIPVQQYVTSRRLSLSLITITGIFISVLGSGVLFKDSGTSILVFTTFEMLVIGLVMGFLGLTEIATQLANQTTEWMIEIEDTMLLRFWTFVNYQFLTLCLGIVLLVTELLIGS